MLLIELIIYLLVNDIILIYTCTKFMYFYSKNKIQLKDVWMSKKVYYLQHLTTTNN